MFNLKYKNLFSLLLLGVIIFLIIFWPRPTQAFWPFGFGGRILMVIPCSNGSLFTVGPPRGGLFMLMPGITKVYSYYQLRPGPWSLGAYYPGGICVAPFGCVLCPPIPALGTMINIGTSLF